MSLATKAIRGTAWMAGASYLGFVFSFAATAALTRLLEPSAFGAYAVATSVCELVFIPAGVSFGQAAIQFQGRQREALEDTVVAMTTMLAALLLVVSLVAAPFLRQALGTVGVLVFLTLSLARALNIVVTAQSAAFEGRFQYRSLAKVRILSALASGGLAVAIAACGGTVEALVARDSFGTVVNAGLFLWLRSRMGVPSGASWSTKTARDVLKVGLGWFSIRTFEVLVMRADQLLLALFVSKEQLGLYANSKYLASLPNSFLAPATSSVALRTYSALEDRPAVQQQMHDLTRYFSLRVLAPAAVPLVLFPKAVLWALFGHKWLEAAPLLAAFVPWLVLMPLFESTKVLLLARHRYRFVSIILFVELALLALTIAASVGPLGAVSGAIGNSLALAITLLLGYVGAGTLPTGWAIKGWWPLPLSTLTAGAIAVWVSRTLNLPEVGWSTFALAVASAVVTLALMISCEPRQFRERFDFVLGRALSKKTP